MLHLNFHFTAFHKGFNPFHNNIPPLVFDILTLPISVPEEEKQLS